MAGNLLHPGSMHRSFFVPAANSRHRAAAKALYRALLRAGTKIPLQRDGQQSRQTHPVIEIIRRRFDNNRSITSLRLIYASMAAGYKFLTMLAKAQDIDTPEYARVEGHIHRHKIQPRKSAPSTIPRQHVRGIQPNPPLLTNTAPYGRPPVYTPTIAPQAGDSPPASDKRRRPQLAATAEGVPFLRMRKPQPRILSTIIRRRQRLYTQIIDQVKDLDENGDEWANREDEWDRLISTQMAEEGIEDPADRGKRPQEMFAWSGQLSRLWLDLQIGKLWEDWVARGDAMQRMVELEQAHALEERSSGQNSVTTSHGRKPPTATDAGLGARVKVGQRRGDAILEIWRRNPTPEGTADPFADGSWAALIKAQEAVLLQRMRTGSVSRRIEP